MLTMIYQRTCFREKTGGRRGRFPNEKEVRRRLNVEKIKYGWKQALMSDGGGRVEWAIFNHLS